MKGGPNCQELSKICQNISQNIALAPTSRPVYEKLTEKFSKITESCQSEMRAPCKSLNTLGTARFQADSRTHFATLEESVPRISSWQGRSCAENIQIRDTLLYVPLRFLGLPLRCLTCLSSGARPTPSTTARPWMAWPATRSARRGIRTPIRPCNSTWPGARQPFELLVNQIKKNEIGHLRTPKI